MSYESDLYEWTKKQADALRRRASNALDWDNLAEEIESLGTSQRSEIRARLRVLLVHLLKWKYNTNRNFSAEVGVAQFGRHEIRSRTRSTTTYRCVLIPPNACRRPTPELG
jgi:Domain of unknown function DUF29